MKSCSRLVFAILLMSGCAWEEGEPFATVAPQLEARYTPLADREEGMGWQRLASSYEIRVDRLVIDAGALSLVSAGSDALGFDPANPPPGYSLCHGGHCHSDDGRLVPYEEIAAELGQGSGASEVMFFAIGAVDLTEGISRSLACEPSCELPLSYVRSALMDLTHITAEGMVRDGRQDPRIAERPWRFEVGQAGDLALTLRGTLDLPADRGHDPDVDLVTTIEATSALFDKVAWTELAVPQGNDEAYDLAADEAARLELLEAFAAMELQFDVNR